MSATNTLPIDELHKAVFERLSADLATLTPPVKVYDDIPEDAQAPYVVLVGQKHRGADTKTTIGWSSSFEVNVWSTYAGTKEVGAIANQVAGSMQREAYELTGFTVLPFGFEEVEVVRARMGDVNGRMAVVRQRLKIVPNG